MNRKLDTMPKLIGHYEAVLEVNLVLLESIPKENRTYGIWHMIESNRNALKKGKESWELILKNKKAKTHE